MADLLERRWQLSIIYAALTGALRFSEFAEAVAGISPRMLSERLRDLAGGEADHGLLRVLGPPALDELLARLAGAALGHAQHLVLHFSSPPSR